MITVGCWVRRKRGRVTNPSGHLAEGVVVALHPASRYRDRRARARVYWGQGLETTILVESLVEV